MLDISRHQELFNPYNFNTPINIIGAGATGSWLILALAKLGLVNINVWDFDKVKEHNLANQAFGLCDVNSFKTDAIHAIIYDEIGVEININTRRFINERLTGIVFLMVDSMRERRIIWENSIKMKSAVKLLIEPRMGLDIGRIYNVEPINLTHIKEYGETFYDDKFTEVSACGTSQTVISTALGITSWCIRQLINWHNKIDLDNEILIDFKYNNLVATKWQ